MRHVSVNLVSKCRVRDNIAPFGGDPENIVAVEFRLQTIENHYPYLN